MNNNMIYFIFHFIVQMVIMLFLVPLDKIAQNILPTKCSLFHMSIYKMIHKESESLPPVQIHFNSEIASKYLSTSIRQIACLYQFSHTSIYNRNACSALEEGHFLFYIICPLTICVIIQSILAHHLLFTYVIGLIYLVVFDQQMVIEEFRDFLLIVMLSPLVDLQVNMSR